MSNLGLTIFQQFQLLHVGYDCKNKWDSEHNSRVMSEMEPDERGKAENLTSNFHDLLQRDSKLFSLIIRVREDGLYNSLDQEAASDPDSDLCESVEKLFETHTLQSIHDLNLNRILNKYRISKQVCRTYLTL